MTKLSDLAKMIDHSILNPAMTDEDLIRECLVAKKFDVASVCVKPYAVKKAVELLKGSDVKVGCVIGFPHGNCSTTAEDIKLMRRHSGPKVQVKCAGGVRTLDDLLKMREAGATRSGATATEVMLKEAKKRFGSRRKQ